MSEKTRCVILVVLLVASIGLAVLLNTSVGRVLTN